MSTAVEEAVAILQEQIDWRGPSGKSLGHIVLKRDVAVRVKLALERLQALDKSKETC